MSESHALEIIAVIVACAAYLIMVSACVSMRSLTARFLNGIALAVFLAGAAYRHYVKRERY